MFDLSKWENEHPAVRRFAQQLVDVLENVAEHLIGQASAAVSDAIHHDLTGTLAPEGAPDTTPAAPEPQAPVQPASDPHPADRRAGLAVAAEPDSTPGALAAARALVDEGYTPAHAAAIAGVDVAELEPSGTGPQYWPQETAPRGPGAGGVGDSGGAGVTLLGAALTPDDPANADEGAPAGVPGADMPVTHNVPDPAAIVGSGTVSG